MNQRKAKMLRRLAERATVGKPNVAYNVGKPPMFAPMHNSLGMLTGHRQVSRGVPTRLADCTRKLYKRLKS